MKTIAGAIEQRLAVVLKNYVQLLHDITSLGDAAGPALTRAIAASNHMLNITLAMAASGGLSKETVEKALDLGEQTANDLIEQALAAAKGKGVA